MLLLGLLQGVDVRERGGQAALHLLHLLPGHGLPRHPGVAVAVAIAAGVAVAVAVAVVVAAGVAVAAGRRGGVRGGCGGI